MHQQITNLTIDNTRLENKVEELEAEVDACHHNIDGYIEGNRRMRAEYEKKLETEQDQTKHWRKKYDNLKENYDELIQLHREWGEEIDRLRKVIIDLQTNRFTTDEFIGMLMKNFMPSADE
jgi:chromosome segregation ATPase